MDSILHIKATDAEALHRAGHDGYEYTIRKLVPIRKHGACNVSLYELPPGKSNYPYHYHSENEESFYILSGTGTVKTPDGNRTVTTGDFLFFPAGERGAHKLTNTSASEPLVYLDFDTSSRVNVCYYPDSNKIAVFSAEQSTIHRMNNSVDYYDGE